MRRTRNEGSIAPLVPLIAGFIGGFVVFSLFSMPAGFLIVFSGLLISALLLKLGV